MGMLVCFAFRNILFIHNILYITIIYYYIINTFIINTLLPFKMPYSITIKFYKILTALIACERGNGGIENEVEDFNVKPFYTVRFEPYECISILKLN